MKTSSINNADYFECTLQFKDGAKKAMSFQQNKRQRLADAETSKSPVKLQQHNVSRGKVWINPPTKITFAEKDDVDFKHNPSMAPEKGLKIGESWKKPTDVNEAELFRPTKKKNYWLKMNICVTLTVFIVFEIACHCWIVFLFS